MAIGYAHQKKRRWLVSSSVNDGNPADEPRRMIRRTADEQNTWFAAENHTALLVLGGVLWVGLIAFVVRPAGLAGSVRNTAAWDGRLAAARAVDVNTADVAELERLPGVGPALAGRIVEERSRRGAFASPEELQRVPGIGPALARRLRGYVTVAAKE